MDYAAATPYAAAAPVASDPQHSNYHHPYAYPYAYAIYNQPAPSAAPSAPAALPSNYYHNPIAPAGAGAVYDPYAVYPYYHAPGQSGEGGSLVQYYFSAGQASDAPASSAVQTGPAAAATESGKHFGFDAQRYAQVAAARASNGMAPPAAAPSLHHAQWNAHFGHPLPKNVSRKHIKKPKVVQPANCEVCKIQCDTIDVLKIHKAGKKHKKNLEKLQDSITPKPVQAPSSAVGAITAPGAVADGVVLAVQTKKNKSSTATPEDLEVKRRRVLEAGAAQGEVKICSVCNVVVNSQKVYEVHIAGRQHLAMVQKQQAQLHNAS